MSARDKQFITNIQLNQEYFYNQDFNLELYELELQYLYEVPNSQIIYQRIELCRSAKTGLRI